MEQPIEYLPIESELVVIDESACAIAATLALSGATLAEARAIGAWLI